MALESPRGRPLKLVPGLLAAALAGAAALLFCLGLGAVVVMQGGLFDTTASTPDIAAASAVIHQVMIRSVQVRAAAIRAPGRFTPAQVQAGLVDYAASCAGCHGAPGVSQAPWAKDMDPAPPYISDAARHWRPRELYWIVGQGVRMTAMPAWGFSRSDAQLWDLVAFLEAMPDIAPKDYARRSAPAPPPDANAVQVESPERRS